MFDVLFLFVLFPFLIKEPCVSGQTAINVANARNYSKIVDILTNALEGMHLERSRNNNP